MRSLGATLLPIGLLTLGSAGLASCKAPPADRLCEAIVRKDVAAVQQVLADVELDLTTNLGRCTPVQAVFGDADRRDAALTAIGVELVKAGLPPSAGWVSPATGQRVSAAAAVAGRGNVELVKALLAVGLDVNGQEAADALTRAAEAGHLEVVRLLVEAGVPANSGEPAATPAARARANGHREVLRYLEEKLSPAP